MCTITEKGKIILSLLQMPGIGRKTVIRYCDIPDHAEYNINPLLEILYNAGKKTNRIKSPDTGLVFSAMQKAEQIIENCHRLGIHILCFMDSDYPKKLLNTDDPPAILYYLGSIDSLHGDLKAVAIIGTLTPTDLGSRIAVRIGETVADAGFISVSGLALGCDTGGHTGSVNKGGISVAILANGLEKIYPEENTVLAQKILSCGGCILSEYPPYTEMQRGYFVDRDRLQAALSDAVFVVETDIQDGTMHTVSFGKKYGRPVYCFRHPEKYGNISTTKGNRKLISDGSAIPVENKKDLAAFISDIKQTSSFKVISPDNYEQLSLL